MKHRYQSARTKRALSLLLVSLWLFISESAALSANNSNSNANADDEAPQAISAKVKSDLQRLENSIAPPGSKEELAERLPITSDPNSLSIFKRKELPPEPPNDHAANSVVKIPPIKLGHLLAVASIQPLEMDAAYSRPISLREALSYAAYNSLPLKISHESLTYQRWQLAGAVVSAVPVPNFGMSYNFIRSRTLPNTIEQSKTFPLSLRFPVFQGGAVVYAMLAQYYREKGWSQSYLTSVNDTLLDVYQRYNNLLLQHALLRIRAKAVQVSEAQLRLNNTQYISGETAALPIMQSRTQLGTDRQALMDQQVAVRQAALTLAFALNLPMSINLIPSDMTLREAAIASGDRSVQTYMSEALAGRPELRQYEMFRLAAARSVSATVAGLYPSISFTTAYTQAKTVVRPPNGTVGGVAVATITAAQNGLGTATANALGQTASFSPTGSTTASSGISNTVATSVVEASGGQPLNVVQSGSLVTSGAASPSFIGSGSGGGAPNINGSNAPGAGVFGGNAETFQGVFSGSWSLSNLGLNTIMSTFAAQALARQAGLQCNQELTLVGDQVRGDYCNLVSARYRIDNAAVGVVSAAESLRLSNLRLVAGTGTNIDAIQAQRDYVNALITQAQSIITSNIAQAQMAHDIGAISIEKLASGTDLLVPTR
ncbi:MAG TPA: TolC family protein [Trichormus sp.]|jgi:outer membrane protein TolC